VLRAEADQWRLLHLLSQSYLHSIFRSRGWRWLAPLRRLRQVLRPRGLDARALIAWRQLVPDHSAAPGSWITEGPDPCFVVPCALPSGRLRLRLRMWNETRGRLRIVALDGDGIASNECLYQTTGEGLVTVDACVLLRRPAFGLQFDPRDSSGCFRIESFEVVPAPLHSLRLWGRRRDPEMMAAPLGSVPSGERVKEGSCERTCAEEYPDLELTAAPTCEWSVVIPTINDCEKVKDCVRSCRRHLRPDTEVEFIVVDDGTREPGIVSALEEESSALGFLLLRNHQNLGFSAAVNHGLRHTRGRFVLICNNDISFRQSWPTPLEQAFRADPNCGILGAKLLYPNGTLQHAGMEKVPGQLRWHHAFAGLSGDHPPANRSRRVWCVTGAFFAVRREVLRRLGGLSVAYGMAYEDLDYCLWAWRQGIGVGYCADVVAVHEEGSTRGASAKRKGHRPFLWAQREKAGADYFERKWAWVRDLEKCAALAGKLETCSTIT
jgi:GT2 family glycosyltransferase